MIKNIFTMANMSIFTIVHIVQYTIHNSLTRLATKMNCGSYINFPENNLGIIVIVL